MKTKKAPDSKSAAFPFKQPGALARYQDFLKLLIHKSMSFFDLKQLQGFDASLEQELFEAEKENAVDKLASRFQSRFGAKVPWLIRKQGARRSAYAFSFGCNFISALAGFYGGSVLMEIFPLPYLNYIGAALGLFLMERFKRQFSDELWDQYWATKTIKWDAAVKNFGLFGISIFLSVFGMYFAAKDLSPEAQIMGATGDPEAVAMQQRVGKLDKELKGLRADKSNYNEQGQFYHIHVPKENAMKNERANLTQALAEKHGIYKIENESILSEWKIRTGFRAYFGVIITLLAEIAFEICMGFCSYYDFRLFRAMRLASQKKGMGRVNGTPKKSPTLAV